MVVAGIWGSRQEHQKIRDLITTKTIFGPYDTAASHDTMNQENTSKLFKDFPELFRDCDRTCMQRGFETGDGWFELIYELCQGIEKEALKAGISRSSDDWPRVEQVKSKFGTLRFYIINRLDRNPGRANIHMESIRKLIEDAVDRSAAICEDCGAPGTLRQDAGLYTSCDACQISRKTF